MPNPFFDRLVKRSRWDLESELSINWAQINFNRILKNIAIHRSTHRCYEVLYFTVPVCFRRHRGPPEFFARHFWVKWVQTWKFRSKSWKKINFRFDILGCIPEIEKLLHMVMKKRLTFYAFWCGLISAMLFNWPPNML